MTEQIGGQMVEVHVLGPDGRDMGTGLDDRERATVEALDRALTANPDFTREYPGARLIRVDSSRGVDEHRQGRYLLRYEVPGKVSAEFWGHLGTAKVDLKKGVVAVPLPPRQQGNG